LQNDLDQEGRFRVGSAWVVGDGIAPAILEPEISAGGFMPSRCGPPPRWRPKAGGASERPRCGPEGRFKDVQKVLTDVDQ